MTGVKYISVSEEFLQLDQQARNCQSSEKLEECRNRQYLDRVASHCDCLPFRLKHLTNISVRLVHSS